METLTTSPDTRSDITEMRIHFVGIFAVGFEVAASGDSH